MVYMLLDRGGELQLCVSFGVGEDGVRYGGQVGGFRVDCGPISRRKGFSIGIWYPRRSQISFTRFITYCSPGVILLLTGLTQSYVLYLTCLLTLQMLG